MDFIKETSSAAKRRLSGCLVVGTEWYREDRDELCRDKGQAFQVPIYHLSDGSIHAPYNPALYGLPDIIPWREADAWHKRINKRAGEIAGVVAAAAAAGIYLSPEAGALIAMAGHTLNSWNNLVAAASSSGTLPYSGYKASFTTEGAGIPHVAMNAGGFPPSWTYGTTGPNSASGAAPDRTTSGFINLGTWPTGSTKRWIAQFGAGGSTQGRLILVDYLVVSDTLNGTLTTAQTVNSVSLPRYTTGAGVMLFLLCWTATGTTASNVTVNVDTIEAPTGVNFPTIAFWTGGWGGGTLGPTAMQLQGLLWPTGATGATQVNSVTLSASTGTAGEFGILITSPELAVCSWLANDYTQINALLDTGLVALESNAALGLIHVPSGTSSGNFDFRIRFLDGIPA